MGMAVGPSGGQNANINVTPLIDVLLVLIVVFMVVVAMSHEKGLQAEIPQPASKDSPPPKIDTNIVIQIAWAGDKQAPALKINQENVKWEDLHDRVRYLQATRRSCCLREGGRRN